jgi:hypothetical protein
MKVDPKAHLAQVTVTRAQPFKQLLAEARSELKKDVKLPPPVAIRPLVKTAIAATSASTLATAQTLGRARTQANAEVQRLGAVRTEAHEATKALTEARSERSEVVQERAAARIFEFITREFTPEAPARVPQGEASIHHLHPAAQVAPKVEAPPEAKAAQAVALIERIEVFVKSQRPGLALTLNNSLGAHVEIERIGPKEIALKLVGHKGPPTAEAVSRIREELRARGLKVGALSVA